MTEKQLFSAPEGWKKIIKWGFRKWTRTFPALTAISYIFGFLVVNAYLSQYHIYDIEFGNVRYLYSGVAFIIYLVVSYLPAGLVVVSIIGDIDSGKCSYIKHQGIDYGLVIFVLIIIFESYVRIAFLACFGAAVFASITSISKINSWYFGSVIAAFIINCLFILNLEDRYPKICKLTKIIIMIPSVFIFFNTMINFNLFMILISSFLIFWYLNVVSKLIEEKGTSNILTGNTITPTVLIVLYFTITFGTVLYGDIPRHLGGGQPFYADIHIREGSASLFSDRKTSTFLTGVKIIHTTDKHVFIDENGEIIRIPDYSIVGMKMKGKVDKEN